MDCRHTLNLSKTVFSMKANLPVRELEWLKEWEAATLYDCQRQRRHGTPKFIQHNSPPYTNGNIHAGTTRIDTPHGSSRRALPRVLVGILARNRLTSALLAKG